jgi:hypothetical protein
MELPDKVCWACGHGHDGTFATRFCSASCAWVYKWRRKHGFHVFKGAVVRIPAIPASKS